MTAESVIATYEKRIAQAIPIALSRHYALNEAQWNAESSFAEGTLSAQQRNEIAQTILHEKVPSIIVFDSESDFKTFCEWHGGRLHQEYLHEEEHASIYRKHGVPCVFGFIKIHNDGHVGLIPWVTPLWQGQPSEIRLRITLEALQNASEKSEGDLQDIRALNRMLS